MAKTTQAALLSDLDGLTTLTRLSARDPGVRPLDAPIHVSDLAPQRRITHGPRPPFWRFAGPFDPTDDPRHVRFTASSPASFVLSSDIAVQEWFNVVKPVANRRVALADSSGASAYDKSEEGAWKKITYQKGRVVFAHVPPANSEPVYLTLTQTFKDCLAHVVRVYRDAYSAYVQKHGAPIDRPDPSTTSGGFPLFVTHPAAKVAGACLGYHHGDYYATMRAASTWCSQMGLGDEFSLANGMGFRSGPLYKWQPIWEPTGTGDWVARREWRGYSQRNRIIYMSPYPVNRLLRPFFSALHAARTMIPGLWRTGQEDAELMRGYTFHYEADISGYDVSVQIQLQSLLCDTICREWPALAGAARTWLLAEQRGLISPSYRFRMAECSLLSAIGATSSGLKPTAEIGTIIATACTRYALHRQGDDFKNWPLLACSMDPFATEHDSIPSVHQGDDARVASNRPLDVDNWALAFKEAGLTCDLIPGYTFLSRIHTPEGRLIPLSGRIVQQTMSNEHEPKGPKSRGLLYLGAISRLQGSEHMSDDLLSDVWTCISSAGWIQSIGRDYGVSNLHDLRHWLETHPASHAAIEVAIAAAASDSWLVSHLRESEHSFASATIVAWATKHGWTSDRIASQDAVCERICDRVSSETESYRMALLSQLTGAAYQGKTALDGIWATLIVQHGN